MRKLALFIWMVLCGCSVVKAPQTTYIALLAPFEGRLREIGYNALYAVRLGLEDEQSTAISLLAVDDGGTVEKAVQRARALAQNPDVVALIAIGPFATQTAVTSEFAPRPAFIVGLWGPYQHAENHYALFNPNLMAHIGATDSNDITNLPHSLIGGDILGLSQIQALAPNLSGITFLSSGQLPDALFSERYRASDLFVPEPNHLATLTYDVARLIVQAIRTQTPLSKMTYEGLNNRIMFDENRYWSSAPIWIYRYRSNGQIIADNISFYPR